MITNKTGNVLREYVHCLYESNVEVRSLNHCCRGKEMSVKYSECVFVALIV